MILVGVVVAAYALAYPAFLWTYRDLRRYPRQLWSAAEHQPYAWRQATIVAYLALGLPAVIVAVAWRVSATRRAMREIAHGHTD